MKKTFSYLAITSCLLLGTTLAYADSDAHHGKMDGKMEGKMQEKMFKAMDANSDGMVATDEFNAFHAKKFKELDVNGNGQITVEEMKTGYKKMMGKMMDDGGRKKMEDGEMDSDSGKAHTQKDTLNHKSEDKIAAGSSDSSCCWTPGDSGSDKSDKKIDDKD